jgi:hypothetical protein
MIIVVAISNSDGEYEVIGDSNGDSDSTRC